MFSETAGHDLKVVLGFLCFIGYLIKCGGLEMPLFRCGTSGSGGELKRVVIGSSDSNAARSFNVANILPDVYQNLTIDNFALVNVRQTYAGSAASQSMGTMPSSYNPSTGILSCPLSRSYADKYKFYVIYTVVCYYVE